MKVLVALLIAAAFIAGSCGNDRGTAPSSIINDEGTVISQEAHDQIETVEQARANSAENGDVHSSTERAGSVSRARSASGNQHGDMGYGPIEAFAPAVIEQDKQTVYVGDSVTYTVTLTPLTTIEWYNELDSEIFNGIAHYEICSVWEGDTRQCIWFDTDEEAEEYERNLIQINAATKFSLLFGQLENPQPKRPEGQLCRNSIFGTFPVLRNGNKIKFQIQYSHEGQYALTIAMGMQYGNMYSVPMRIRIGNDTWRYQYVHER